MEKATGMTYFDGHPVTKKQRLIFFIIIIGYLFDQVDNINFGIIAPSLIKNWGASVKEIGFIGSMYFIGMFFGGLLGGFFADKFGRKKTFLFSVFVFSLFSLINAFTPNIIFFAVCRVFTGIGLASMTVVSLSYIAEMAPGEIRGKLQSIIMFGCLLIMPVFMFFFSYIIPLHAEAWRLVLIIGALGFIPAIIGLFSLRESPRWLVSKGRYQEAEKIIQELVPGIQIDLSNEKQPPKVKLSLQLAEMFGEKYLRYSLLLIFIVIMYWPASFVINNFAPSLLVAKGFPLEAGLRLAALGTVAGPVGALAAAFIADRGGRKIPLSFSFFGASIATFAYGYMNNLNSIYTCCLLYSFFNVLISAIIFAYIPENFSTKVRSTATGIVWSIARPATAVMQLLAPLIVMKYSTIGLFSILGCMFFLGGITLALFGRRTAGISLEELHGEI